MKVLIAAFALATDCDPDVRSARERGPGIAGEFLIRI